MRTSDSFYQAEETRFRQQPRAIAIAATRPAPATSHFLLAAHFLLGVCIIGQCLAFCVSYFLK
jgi:hypothetical protein